jgi:ArsR family transcriptional regulator, arsenate/arsenite/antimonite-responsive transcriptional repressor
METKLKAAYDGVFMEMFLKVMKAMSDANRVKILKMLQHKSLCVCELQASLGVAQPTVSKHLRILVDSGLAQWSREGKWIVYRLADGCANPFASVILGNLRHWLDNDPLVSAAVKQIPSLCREKLCGSRHEAEAGAHSHACMSN